MCIVLPEPVADAEHPATRLSGRFTARNVDQVLHKRWNIIFY